jgi:hypothetical protein
MSLNGFSKSLLFISIVSATGMAFMSAHAASPCKGLDESACMQSQSCSWVSSYTTKHGATVSAYCRNAVKKMNQGINKKEGEGTQSGAIHRTEPSASKNTTTLEENSG